MFNIHVIIILIRSIFHALDKHPIHQIQFRVLLSQDAFSANSVDCHIVEHLPVASKCAEEQVLVRVRPGACGNGVHLAVDGPHRKLYSAHLEGLDVRHLHGRIQAGLLCEQCGIDDVDLVIGFSPAGHERKRRLAAYKSYLDIDAVDQEFILHEQVHVGTARHVDDTTPDDVRSSSHEPCISRGPVSNPYEWPCPCATADSSVAWT